MSVSEKAVELVFAQLKATRNGATYEELTKRSGYSIATVKNVVSLLKSKGNIAVSYTRPTVIKAVAIPPSVGQTLVIREPMPPLELDQKIIAGMISAINSEPKAEKDKLIEELFKRAREGNPQSFQKLMVFLVNYTEVLRQMLANNDELSITDLDGK